MTAAFREILHGCVGPVAETAKNGRGLLIVRSIAQRFGFVDKGEIGKMLWFEIEWSQADAASPFSSEARQSSPVNLDWSS